METTQQFLEETKESLKGISPWPWCEMYCYDVIRHGDRNMDIEEHSDCKENNQRPGRYDGNFIAKAPETISELLKIIESQAKQIEAMSWQPIETAPKDETLILAFSDEATEPVLVRFVDGGWRNNHYGSREPYFLYPKLKFWMPIPTQPNEVTP